MNLPITNRQQFIQSFVNFLDRDNLKYSEHVVSYAQKDQAVSDSLAFFSRIHPCEGQLGNIIVTEGSKIVKLPMDWLIGNVVNDNILRSVELQRDPSFPPPNYQTFNYQNYWQGSIDTRLASRAFSQNQMGISQPLRPNSIVTGKPPVNKMLINGVMTPYLTLRYYTPTSSVTYNVLYIPIHRIEDAKLVLLFNSKPTNGQSFSIDGTTITFVTSNPTSNKQYCVIASSTSQTMVNLQVVLAKLKFIAFANGSRIYINVANGGAFDYDIGTIDSVATYTDEINSVFDQHLADLSSIMFCQCLLGKISELIDNKGLVDSIFNYVEKKMSMLRGSLVKR